MKHYIIAIFATFLAPLAYASFPEFFGTYATTSGIGNQANMDYNDPSNVYYIPALAAFADTVAVSAVTSNVSTDFQDINNVTTKNSTNSTTTETGNVKTDYQSYQGSGVHIILPIRYKGAGSLGLSFFSPVGKIVETHSGDPELPEYVMYRSRYRRTQFFFNYAHPINELWAFSLGVHLGFQASAHVVTNVSLGDNFGSSASAKSDVRPSLGAVASVVRRDSYSMMYFTFQQEMKSNLDAQAFGEITDPPLTLINIGINSMIYYDPHILRIGYDYDWASWFKTYAALEYQLWGNYKPPTISVTNLGGTVRGSNGHETVKTKSIFVPKIGMKIKASNSIGLMAGASYRPTPIKGDFSGSGNSVDTDTYIFAAGSTYDMKIFSRDLQLGLSGQYHKLKEKKVTKTTGQENGGTGNKLGGPGYTVGGDVIMVLAGMKLLF